MRRIKENICVKRRLVQTLSLLIRGRYICLWLTSGWYLQHHASLALQLSILDGIGNLTGFRLVQVFQGRMEDGMRIKSNLANRTNKVKFSKNEPKPTVQGEAKEEFHVVLSKS